MIVRRVLGESDSSKVPLTELTQGMLFRYQELAARKCLAKISDPVAKREALTDVLRSTKSAIRQARSCFGGRGVDFISRFEAEGLVIPPNILEFVKCKIRGEQQRK